MLVDLLNQAACSPYQRLGPCDLVIQRNQQLRNLVVIIVGRWAGRFAVWGVFCVASSHGNPGLMVTSASKQRAGFSSS